MREIDFLARDFLAQRRIAVAGVSAKRDDAANFIYRTLRARGYQVFAVNPKMSVFDGDPCYRDLKSIPGKVDGVVIVTSSRVAEDVVRQCIEADIRRVWLHCALGTHPRFGKKIAKKIGSVSSDAVRLCNEHQISVIPGSCPMQFLGADFPHTCMRWTLGVVGALEV